MFGFFKKKKTANIMGSSRSTVELICQESDIILPGHDKKIIAGSVRHRTLELDGKTLVLFDGKDNARLFCKKSVLAKKNKEVSIDDQTLAEIFLSPDTILKSPAAIEKIAMDHYKTIKVDRLIIICPSPNYIGKMSILYYQLANSMQNPKNFKECSNSILTFLNAITHGNCEINFKEVYLFSHDNSGTIESFMKLTYSDMVSWNRGSLDKNDLSGSNEISEEIGIIKS